MLRARDNDDDDNNELMLQISKSLARSQKHLKSIADCLRVFLAITLVVLFFAYQHIYKGRDPEHAADAAGKAVAEAAKDASKTITGSATSAVAVPTPATVANPPAR